ncbi:MAG: SUMF1/EgtB/PvdO family nonheme iron enzyme [Planctomycetota bacterium]
MSAPFCRASVVVLALASAASPACAAFFGSGEDQFSIEFVPIGSPGNSFDQRGAPRFSGSVAYEYSIAKFEVSERAVRAANELGGLGITLDERGPDKPATSVTWIEAARFVNWLNEDRGFFPAYKFTEIATPIDPRQPTSEFEPWEIGDPGFNPANPFRNRRANYFLPSIDEWYKAAYYDPVGESYFASTTSSDADPIPVASGTDPGTAVFRQFEATDGPADVMLAGGESPFGVVGLGGNIDEWNDVESVFFPLGRRPARGGAWGSPAGVLRSTAAGTLLATSEGDNVGFRVVSLGIPEPTAIALVILGLSVLPHRLRSH